MRRWHAYILSHTSTLSCKKWAMIRAFFSATECYVSSNDLNNWRTNKLCGLFSKKNISFVEFDNQSQPTNRQTPITYMRQSTFYFVAYLAGVSLTNHVICRSVQPVVAIVSRNCAWRVPHGEWWVNQADNVSARFSRRHLGWRTLFQYKGSISR